MPDFTIGGFPAADGWTFRDPDICRQYGQIIQALFDADPKINRQAYLDYHDFRGRFTLDEWGSMAIKLSELRREHNHPSIEGRVKAIYVQVVNGVVRPDLAREQARPPAPAQPFPEIELAAKQRKMRDLEKPEQQEMFAALGAAA